MDEIRKLVAASPRVFHDVTTQIDKHHCNIRCQVDANYQNYQDEIDDMYQAIIDVASYQISINNFESASIRLEYPDDREPTFNTTRKCELYKGSPSTITSKIAYFDPKTIAYVSYYIHLNF